MRVIDIGCGPGYILRDLPQDIDYIGFDIDEGYINHARQEFGNRGRFFCQYFDADAAREFAPADIVMMNGVLHHIPDNELKLTLSNVRNVLRDGGLLFTLDGCYREGQSRFAKWMLDNDRGRFVRDERGYANILSAFFETVDLKIREDYARVPYTFAIALAQKRTASQNSAEG
jgi:SAM-dependent methyltransferase